MSPTLYKEFIFRFVQGTFLRIRGRETLSNSPPLHLFTNAAKPPHPRKTGGAWGGLPPHILAFSSAARERLQPRLRPAEDQGVDVVGAFVGVYGFEVHDVADDVVFVGDAVAAVHVA